MNKDVYDVFSRALDKLDTAELRCLEHELDEKEGFRIEAGEEFSKAVHNERDRRLFKDAA